MIGSLDTVLGILSTLRILPDVGATETRRAGIT